MLLYGCTRLVWKAKAQLVFNLGYLLVESIPLTNLRCLDPEAASPTDTNAVPIFFKHNDANTPTPECPPVGLAREMISRSEYGKALFKQSFFDGNDPEMTKKTVEIIGYCHTHLRQLAQSLRAAIQNSAASIQRLEFVECCLLDPAMVAAVPEIFFRLQYLTIHDLRTVQYLVGPFCAAESVSGVSTS
jgi:hypothetical protein